MSAVVSWQQRNLLGQEYQFVPGYGSPHRINIYGVRWDFFN